MSNQVENFDLITGFTSSLIDSVNQNPHTSTQIIKNDWSRTKCEEIASRYLIPSKIINADKQRELIIQFLNFYLTGNIDDTYNVSDVILAVAHMIQLPDAKTTSNLIWEAKHYDSKDSKWGFSIEKHDVTTEKPATTSSTPPTAVTIQIQDTNIHVLGEGINYESTTTKPKTVARPEEDTKIVLGKVATLLQQYTNESVHSFRTYCNNVFTRSPASSSPTKELLNLYKLCNFVALTMLRATTKTKAQMVAGFLKKQYQNNISTFASPDIGSVFVPPCERCLKMVSNHITKARPQISSTLAKIVLAAITGSEIKSFLDASILTHTSWNGLGILQMLFDICEFYGKTWIEIYHLTILNSTASSWRKIIDFLKKHQSLTSPDPTVPWARVIDDAYFTKMGPQNHAVLASIFKRSLEYAQGEQGLSDAMWAQRHYKIVENCGAASDWLLAQFVQQNRIIVAGAKESLGMAEAMNKGFATKIIHEPIEAESNPYEDA